MEVFRFLCIIYSEGAEIIRFSPQTAFGYLLTSENRLTNTYRQNTDGDHRCFAVLADITRDLFEINSIIPILFPQNRGLIFLIRCILIPFAEQ